MAKGRNKKKNTAAKPDKNIDSKLLSIWDRLSTRLFTECHTPYSIIILICLFGFGVFHWIQFFNFGKLEFSVLDWPKDMTYLRITKQSFESGELPLYTLGGFQNTNLFLALPESLLSPQIVLLKFMSPEQFMVANVIILFLIGFIGSIFLAKELKLTPAALFIFLILFNFNGYITSHIAAGHTMWLGYFTLPFFTLIILKACNGYNPIRLGLFGGMLLLLMLLQGSFHMWVWCVLFLVFLAIANRNLRIFSLVMIISSALLGFFRLLPGAIFIKPQSTYLSGFPSLSDCIAGFTQLRGPGHPWSGGFSAEIKLGWWEYDLFVGLVGFAFILWFGVYRGLFKTCSESIKPLRFPIFMVTFVTIADIWWVVTELPIPFSSVERVSSRFICIPFIFVIAIACARFSNWDKLKERWAGWIALLLSINCFFELMQHSHLWSIRQIEMNRRLNYRMFDLNKIQGIIPIPGNNPFYESVLMGSLAVSIVSLLGIVSYLIWSKNHTKTS